MMRLLTGGLLAWAIFAAATLSATATEIRLVNNDGTNEGFNDQRPATPGQTGNNGTTLGQQRINVFQAAADYWEARLASNVPVLVRINFDPLQCSARSAVLGSAGPRGIFRDFPNAPAANTWYVGAVADSLSGSDRSPGNPDIGATFNSDIDNNPDCLGNTNWWLGINSPAPRGTISLFDTVLHEIGHGLGVLSLVSQSGQLNSGRNDAYSNNLFDETTNRFWRDMTDAQRAASATNTGNVTWRGANADANSSHVIGGKTNGHLRMFAPSPYRQGSSISHWDTALSPDELMEPSATPTSDDRATLQLLKDVGWRLAGDSVPTPVPGTIGLRAANVSVVENASPATIELERTGGSDGAVSVIVNTANGTAVAGSDYTRIANRRIQWADGESGVRTVDVTINNDGLTEASGETLTVRLSEVAGGATLGRNRTTLTIFDPPNRGVIRLRAANASVVENAGPGTIQLERTGGSDGLVSVLVNTENGTAIAGSDYTRVANRRIQWADGESGVRTVNVTVNNDGIAEAGGETLRLRLSNVTGGATLGRSVTLLTITDPPQVPTPGAVGFTSNASSVSENAGAAILTLRRTGGSDGAVRVFVTSTDVSATAGFDYQSITNRAINWADGEAGNKTFELIVLADDVVETNGEQVLLTLSNATGGATIDSGSLTLTIGDATVPSDPPVTPPDDSDGDALFQIIPALAAAAAKQKKRKQAESKKSQKD